VKLDPNEVRDELLRLARVASGLLDGDEVRAILTDRAAAHLVTPDPEYRFLTLDHYDVRHGPFLRTKKLLMRIERLAPVDVNGAIWVPAPDADHVTVALHNGPHHRFYRFGMTRLPTPPALRRVFETGEPAALPPEPGGHHVTALAPVRNSLRDVAAVVELTAPTDLDAPAWA
jgi:hypothetical protein